MDASTRLYKRLGEIPEDPNDPDSLDDLVVCAFGAFERYYLCWKTRAGEYKQDDYGLPPALKDWLYPSDGSTRDFDSLQVVFGRGEEYFASDKDGKVEHKEPEVRKQTLPLPVEDEEKLALRRSRTVSFLRPLSETSVRSDSVFSDSTRSKRSSSISSQRTSRPPSLSYTNSRTNSEVSILGDTILEGQASQSTRPSYISQWNALSSSALEVQTELLSPNFEAPSEKQESISVEPLRTATIPLRALDAQLTITRTLEDTRVQQNATTVNVPHCTCGCHATPQAPPPPPSPPKPAYANATTQTTPPPSPPSRRNTTLRIDTAASWEAQDNYTENSYYEEADDYYDGPPVIMSRMSSYFCKPDYQLGDSLFSGYQPIDWGTTYVYQDTFGEEALR
ncbi:hypothetical protein ACJBU6_02683 [Exserohilum turcicum]